MLQFGKYLGGTIPEFDDQFFKNLSITASLSTRKRINQNLHKTYSDEFQRFFNAMDADTYICPHMHYDNDGNELLVPIKGVFGVIYFDDDGKVASASLMSNELWGDSVKRLVEKTPGTWHTVVALSEVNILLECKKGPFQPARAKLNAKWAPEEGCDSVTKYLRFLKQNFV